MKKEKAIQQFVQEYESTKYHHSLRSWDRLIHRMIFFQEECERYGIEENGLYEASAVKYKYVIEEGKEIFFECPNEHLSIIDQVQNAMSEFLENNALDELSETGAVIWDELSILLRKFCEDFEMQFDEKNDFWIKQLMDRYQKIHALKKAEINQVVKEVESGRWQA